MFGISESISTVSRHYKAGNLNWPMIIYITLAHIAALIGLFTIGECHRYTLLWAFILWPIRFVYIYLPVVKDTWTCHHSTTFTLYLIAIPFISVVVSVLLEAYIGSGLIDLTKQHFLFGFI